MEQDLIISILLAGAVIILSIGIKYAGTRIGFPPLVGYIVLGLMVQYIAAPLLTAGVREIFAFLADIGIIVLLFRVGLESDLTEMIKHLPQASLLWVSNVFFSGGLGFWAAYYLIGWELIPSLFVAVALTATSVGISVLAWQEARALDSSNGALMLDIAEMDDVSGVVFMALLFAVAPLLQHQEIEEAEIILVELMGVSLVKLIVFGAMCYLIARYVERPVTAFFEKLHGGQEALLVVLGVGLVVASLAGLLGFSVAIGAFFAGLIFSRDPKRVNLDASFDTIFSLFMPFFFVGVGLDLELGALSTIGIAAVVVLLAAVAGKIIGTAVPAWITIGGPSALLLGVSMVPRAEIALIVMQRGVSLGDWAVSMNVFANMIVVCAVTSLVVPFALRPMFKRWPQA